MDQQPRPESRPAWTRHPLLIPLWVIAVIFFLFGDVAIRAIWHVSFWSSMLLWAGVLSVLFLALIALTHFLDR